MSHLRGKNVGPCRISGGKRRNSVPRRWQIVRARAEVARRLAAGAGRLGWQSHWFWLGLLHDRAVFVSPVGGADSVSADRTGLTIWTYQMCPEAANRPSDGVMEDQNFHLFQALLLTMCDQSLTFTLLILGTLAFLAGVSSTAHAQNVFTVDATGDAPDTTPGDGTCATSGGNCTLRAAIQEANNTANATVADPDRIEFGISGTASPTSPHVIQPGSALPQITDQVVIDGTTEPDYDTESLGDSKPVVEIDGASAGDNVDGLNVGGGADGSRIDALSVINFNGSGASNGGAGIRGVDGLDVEGCYLSVRADGSTVAPNDRGIVLTGSDNTIVNSDLGGSNIIGGNDLQGIVVEGSDNSIKDNLIGTSPSGDDLLDLGNGAGASGSGEGIRLAGDDNELVFNAFAFNAGPGLPSSTERRTMTSTTTQCSRTEIRALTSATMVAP